MKINKRLLFLFMNESNGFAIEIGKFMKQEIIIRNYYTYQSTYFSKPHPLSCICFCFVAENDFKTNPIRLEMLFLYFMH